MTSSNNFSNLLTKTLCPFKWQDIELTHSYLESAPSPKDLQKELCFGQALSLLCKDLSFFALLEVSEKALKVESFDLDKFFDSLGYRNLNASELKTELKKFPIEFFTWAKEKGLGPKDLRGFLKDYTPTKHSETFIHICKMNPTKSTGVLSFELALDLLCNDLIKSQDILEFKNSEPLFKFLKKKRFKKTFSKDDEISTRLSKINFSENIKCQLKRDGDTRKLNLEIKASSPSELLQNLKKTESRIEKIQEAWMGE